MADVGIPRERVTLQAVAERAGVHRATVSRALRETGLVAEPLRSRLVALAAEMGYRPDPMMSAPASYRRRDRGAMERAVAVVGMQLDPKLRVVERQPEDWEREVCVRLGYAVKRFDVGSDGGEVERLGTILEARGIRGMLLRGPGSLDARISFRWPQVACVGLGGEMRRARMVGVVPNYFESMTLTLARLAKLGYRRPGLWDSRRSREAPDFVRIQEAACQTLSEDFFKRPAPPVFYSGDWRASAVRGWVREHGIDVVIYRGSGGPIEDWLAKNGISIPDEFALCATNVSQERSSGLAGTYCDSRLLLETGLDVVNSLMQRGCFGPLEQPYSVLLPSRWRDGRSAPARG